MDSRFLKFIPVLTLLNGCASNPAAYQRVQERQKDIRSKRAEQRTEKFFKDFTKYQERITSEYIKEFDILADPFSTLDQKEQPLIKTVQAKMDTTHMGFWEGFHPVNDALALYPLERYIYWMNDELRKAQKLEERFIRRGLDTATINKLINNLAKVRDIILKSDAYQTEKEQRQTSLAA